MVYLFICVQVGRGGGWLGGVGTRSAVFSPQQKCLNVNICTVNNNYFVSLFFFPINFFYYFVNKRAKKGGGTKTKCPASETFLSLFFFFFGFR